MELCGFDKCLGCGACFNICPNKCILMKTFSDGYKYPIIDQNGCVECGLCVKSCPAINDFSKKTPMAVFSASYKWDDNVLLESSSGGIAYVLSKFILENGGVVFGAAYDENMNVRHVCVNEANDLYKLQGSKYVQSDTGDTFSEVRNYLLEKKMVLYFGLPCQIGGLYSFLKKKYDNLFTCDLLCGGAPSPGVFQTYIEYLTDKYGCKVDSLNFRCKKYDYGYLLLLLLLSNGESHILYGPDAYYIKSLGAGYIRNSCFDCEYASMERVGDVTIGDFWNLKVDAKIWRKGVSMILVNTLQGKDLLYRVKNELFLQERNIDDVMHSQTCAISKEKKRPHDYYDFFEDYQKMKWDVFARKYLTSKSIKQRMMDNIHPAIVVKAIKVRNILRKMVNG